MSAKGFNIAINVASRQFFTYLYDGDAIAPGTRVRVRFGKNEVTGIVIAQADTIPSGLKLKKIESVIDQKPIIDSELLKLCLWCADYYCHSPAQALFQTLPSALKSTDPIPPRPQSGYTLAAEITTNLKTSKSTAALKKLFASRANTLSWTDLERNLGSRWQSPMQKLIDEGIVLKEDDLKPKVLSLAALSSEQQSVVDEITNASKGYQSWLLQGVTGSGKTQVYIELIKRQLEKGLQTLILTPEIGLTPELENRILAQLCVQVSTLHSKMTPAARLRSWSASYHGISDLIIGTRLCVFAPLKRPGLIIVDEEHDASFKQMDAVRHHARDVAIMRAHNLGIPIVLGSATPSIESMVNVSSGKHRPIELKKRFGGATLPKTRIIDLGSQSVHDGLSLSLEHALRDNLEKGYQSMVFINRRGFAPLLRCSSCAWQSDCLHCSSSMVLHLKKNELRCHHCMSSVPLPSACPSCQRNTLIKIGSGTQRLEEKLNECFPNARIKRIDKDTSPSPKAFEHTMCKAASGELDILVGTQMLSKGHDLPNLTLVAILDVDQGLFASDFRAHERLAQLLMQVSGRAGRRKRQGFVYIQTFYPESQWWKTLESGHFAQMQSTLIEQRKQSRWPPFSHLLVIHAEALQAPSAANFLMQLRSRALKLEAAKEVEIFEPIASAMERRSGYYRYQLLFRCESRSPLNKIAKAMLPMIDRLPKKDRLRWYIDVDPMDLY